MLSVILSQFIFHFYFFLFFFNDTATTEIYTLSLHDALPISKSRLLSSLQCPKPLWLEVNRRELSEYSRRMSSVRSEEHTSELQSPCNLVCRVLLEKKKKK